MGDIADDLYEKMVDGMSFTWHWRAPAPPPKCRQCGVLCTWSQRKGKWTLFENGTPHQCKQSNLDNIALQGFESIE